MGPAAAGVPTDDTNLIRRALALVGRTAHVRVEKHIPAGGGLGGGSSDAAAILRWAGVDDLDLAASLGADVPFCLIGGRARVTGVGEIVDPLPFVDRTFTVVTPPLSVSTPASTAPGTSSAVRDPDQRPRGRPRSRSSRGWLRGAHGSPGSRARSRCSPGSGSTWFVEGDHGGAAAALAPAMVVVTRTDRP